VSFFIDVWVNDAAIPLDEVIAFGFDILISDSSIVSYTSYDIASPFDDDSASFLDTDTAGSVFPGLPDDYFQIATLYCSALKAGEVTLGIISDMTDPNEGLHYLGRSFDISKSINITVRFTPEPATFMLCLPLFIVLIGMARVKKKYKEIRRRFSF
jgi:hypothetical protein